MPVRNLSRTRPIIWIPGSANVKTKIVITDDDSTDHTVMNSYTGAVASNYALAAEVTRTATDKLGSFKIQLANDGGRFYKTFDGGETVKIYMDTTDATTLIFVGEIDNVSYGLDSRKGFFVNIDGRDYPEMIDKTISDAEGTVTADISLSGILYNFYDDVTLVFWNGTAWAVATYDSDADTVSWSPAATGFPTTTITMAYQHNKGWSVIKEICGRAGLDCYMEYDDDNSRWTLRTFVEEDITNANAGVAYGVNLITLSPYGTNNNEVFNRIFVYGKQESDNIVLLKTEEDSTSQSNLWVKDKIINATDLLTMDEVQEKADYELSANINVSASGKITAIALPALKPGDVISCSIPYSGIGGSYKVQGFTHKLTNPTTTTLDLTKKIKGIADIFVEKDNPDELFIGGGVNLNEMKDSYTVYFDESPSVISHDDTQEVDGRLRLDDGKIWGQATANYITADYGATECELRRYESYDTTLDTYEVTNDGGATWETYTPDSTTKIHSFAKSDNRVAFRVTMVRAIATDPSPAYESICLLYK